MKKKTQRLVASGILLIAFSLLYVGSYLACVGHGTIYEFSEQGEVPLMVGYRLPWEKSASELKLSCRACSRTLGFEQSFAASFFAPANWIDRRLLRPEYWNRVSTLW